MEKRWPYGVIYSVIQLHLVWGLLERPFHSRKVIYASPGKDVNLTCQKKGFLVQTQWSKITNVDEIIALYNPLYGYFCTLSTDCDSLVTFTNPSPNVSEWTLHLRNVSTALSGKYKCSFVLYPEGAWTKVFNFLVQTEVVQEETGGNYIVEVLFHHTLEIPCFPNLSSVISSGITFAWLMEKNGMEETLFIKNDTFLENRAILLKDRRLCLSPVEILDDDKKFSCHVTTKSGKILKNATRIKVFAKPEIFMNMQNNFIDILEEKNFSCLVKNVFPTANLSWYSDGEHLQNGKGIHITTEKRKGNEGFYELTSMLRFLKPKQSILPNNLTIWCTTLFPVPGNEVWNISSRKIAFSFGHENAPTDPSNISVSTISIIPPSLNSMDIEDFLSTTSLPPVEMSSTLSNPDSTFYTHQFNSGLTTQSYPNHSKKEIESNVWVSTLTYNSTPSEADTTLNGSVPNKPKRRLFWPVAVASLLFICFFPFGLGIRKWYQYQKEIMERPPPFKPPPPPVKYTCMQESFGGVLPCHEMETL